MQRYGYLIDGESMLGSDTVAVLDKFRGEPFAQVAVTPAAEVERAVSSAKSAMEREPLTPWRRFEILSETSRLILRDKEELVRTMVAETGFTLREAGNDVERCAQTLLISAEEAKRLEGELVPLAGARGEDNRIGFTLRVPIGVVCAITPFNSPLNTVAHKVAPALAAGNSVVLKPAMYTPVSALHLARLLGEAGLPAGYLNVVFGSGAKIGAQLVADQRIRFYTFTGSTEVGRTIQQGIGLRRSQMELGSIATTIVCHDADLERASQRCAAAAFRKAGQVCTSVQRIFVERAAYPEFVERLAQITAALTAGDPSLPETDMGPMISLPDAERVESWLTAAIRGGAKAHTPVKREGPLLWPVLLTDVTPEMNVSCKEVFGPMVSVTPFDRLVEAIAAVNSTPYGLTSGIFTRDMDVALRAAAKLEVGVVQINEPSSSRVDLMPFGGVKDSGFGKEGPRYAMREMSEERLIVLNLKSSRYQRAEPG